MITRPFLLSSIFYGKFYVHDLPTLVTPLLGIISFVLISSPHVYCLFGWFGSAISTAGHVDTARFPYGTKEKHSGSPFVIVIVFPSLIFFVAHHLAYGVWG